MSIPFSKYINITSGVGAGARVNGRSFIARVFSDNILIPIGASIEFPSLVLVADYFGTQSEEYLRASFYFSFTSKNITRPQSISFARFSDVAVKAAIFGSELTVTQGQISTITNGFLGISVGGVDFNVGPMNFSTDTSFSEIAARIQTAIRTSVDPQYATATVVYDVGSKGFNFESGVAGDATISTYPGVGGANIIDVIGWGALAIFSNGSDVKTLTQILNESVDFSDNFGSFCFTASCDLSVFQVIEAATWNAAQNVKYMFMAPPTNNPIDSLSYFTSLKDFGGTCLTYNIISGQFPEMLPMAIFASTDFTKVNSVQNYMFYQAALDSSVKELLVSNTLDSERTNYYGNTQEAGNTINFYQRGVLLGPYTSPSDINVYANEIWLKDAAGVAIMQLLLNVGRVSANNKGRGQILASLQSVITQALLNGTISSEKKLTTTQILYINEITGDNTAYHQVGGIGYWLNVSIEQFTNPNSNLTEYKATYLLVYSKDDAIRFVEGTHVLI